VNRTDPSTGSGGTRLSRRLWFRSGSSAVVAGGLLAWAITSDLFRDAEGLLTGRVCFPVAVAAACMLLGTARSTRWQRAACWLCVLVVGQAAALQLVAAGPAVGYQHYETFSEMMGWPSGLFLVVVGLQGIAVTFAIAGRAAELRPALSGLLAAWQWVLVAGVFVSTSAVPSLSLVTYGGELLFAAAVQAVNLATVILVVVSLPYDRLEGTAVGGWFPPGPGDSGTAADGDRRAQTGAAGFDRVAGICAAAVVVVAALLALVSYQQHPHVPDEVAYLYHARTFAAGALTLPAPPDPDAFHLNLMDYEGDRWFAPTPPGWPLALALGVLVGVPWLVNPVLGGLNVLLIWVLIRDLYDGATARWVVVLAACSPWFVFMAMNFMPHTFALTCALGAGIGLGRVQRTGKPSWAIAAGLSLGVLSWIRPLEALALAVLLGLWALGWGGRRLRAPALAGFVLAALAVGALVLPYNRHLTGDPLYAPIMAYTDEVYGAGTNAVGFGPERGLGWIGLDPLPGHGLLDVLLNANVNLFAVNTELLGWPTGSLLLLTVFVLSGALRRSDRLMVAVALGIVGIHSLYWFSGGPDFGARYWYLIIVPCLVLTVRGMAWLPGALPGSLGDPGSRRLAAAAAVVCLCGSALVNYFPWRAIDKYLHYRGMRPDVRYLAERHDFGRSVVLVRGRRHPDYASAAIYNPLDLFADAPIYVFWDRDPRAAERVLELYDDRPIWVIEGPTVTDDGFEVAAGPLAHEELSGLSLPAR